MDQTPGVCALPFAYAAGIGAAASLANGVLGANASQNAAKTQANAANNASAIEQSQFDQTKQLIQPFVSGGTNALTSLEQLLGIGSQGGATSPILAMLGLNPGGTGQINPSTFQGSPGYQYALQQGTGAVTNSAAANGGLGGNALRQLQSTGQGLANQNWNQYLGQANNAYQNLVGNVAGVASTGLNAVNSLGGFGASAAGQIGGNTIGAGNALAAGQIGSANALSGAINGVGQNASLYALLNQFQSGGGGNNSLSAANNASIALGPTNNPNLFAASYGYSP